MRSELPRDLSEEAVRDWLLAHADVSFVGTGADDLARAVLAWAEAKARDCVAMVRHEGLSSDEVIARVFGRGEESRG